MVTSGQISQEEYDKLIAKQKALEEDLRKRAEKGKASQLSAICARIAQRKAKRLADLREQHERDKNKVMRIELLVFQIACALVTR